jgi:hypothetical protein
MLTYIRNIKTPNSHSVIKPWTSYSGHRIKCFFFPTDIGGKNPKSSMLDNYMKFRLLVLGELA